MKFSIKDFFSKCDQFRTKLRIWSHLLKKSLMENLIFCAMIIFENENWGSLSSKEDGLPYFLGMRTFLDALEETVINSSGCYKRWLNLINFT